MRIAQGTMIATIHARFVFPLFEIVVFTVVGTGVVKAVKRALTKKPAAVLLPCCEKTYVTLASITPESLLRRD